MMTLRHCPEKAKAFWKGVAENDGLRRGDPRHALVTALLGTNRSKGMSGAVGGIQIASLAWNAFYEGRRIQTVRVLKSDDVRLLGTPLDGRRR